jgi:glycine cleavage system regulatory protein
MDSCFIMSVTGPFTPDIINQLAHHSRNQGATWNTSKVIRLDNQFTALMQVSIASIDEARLTSSLLEAFPQLQLSVSACAGTNQAALEQAPLTLSAPMEFELDCADRAGLTHDIHRLLETLSIHVEHFESYRLPVVILGRNVYRAKLVLRLPETQSSQSVVNELEALEAGARANVKISVE